MLTAVLQALRDRPQVIASEHLAMRFQLHELSCEGWQPANLSVKERRRDEFPPHITDAFLKK